MERYVQKAPSENGLCMTKKKNRSSLSQRAQQAQDELEQREKIEITEVKEGGLTLNYIGKRFTDPDQLIKEAGVDMDLFEVDRVVINNYETAGKLHFGQDETGYWKPQELWKTGNLQIKVWLRRKKDQLIALESLLKRLEKKSPICRKIRRKRIRKGNRRMIEISIMDPHLGMICHKPASQNTWSLDECEEMFMSSIDELIRLAEPFMPVEQVVFTFGNDYLHADNIHHTTTQGTPQPEMSSWHHVYERGAELAVTAIDRIKQVAAVKVYSVPGNHDRQSTFTLGRELKAYYRRDKNVEVDASSSPYKFHKYGVNLIGFDHGHSIKPPLRLTGLMANECSGPGSPRQGWFDSTIHREWHCGDQHRKSSFPFSEQGVTVEYCPGLTPVNEWHKIKGFNWQQRGAMAWIWDYDRGPIHRLQVNISQFTGEPLWDQVSTNEHKKS